jgi:hypothetical protein
VVTLEANRKAPDMKQYESHREEIPAEYMRRWNKAEIMGNVKKGGTLRET